MKKNNILHYQVILCTCYFSYLPTQAQNITAAYSLETDVPVPKGDGKEKGTYTYYYTGQIYQSEQKIACYIRQDFEKAGTEKRIANAIEVGQLDNGTHIVVNKPTYTLVDIMIYKQDSIVVNRWTGFNNGFSDEWYYSYFTFTKPYGYAQPTGDTAIKYGMRCIRILFYRAIDKKLDFDGWIYPDVKLTYGFHNLRNFPGLIVEGFDYGMKYKYKLVDLKIDQPINQSVFWPAKFANASFTKPQDNNKTTVEKNKKKADIMVQN